MRLLLTFLLLICSQACFAQDLYSPQAANSLKIAQVLEVSELGAKENLGYSEQLVKLKILNPDPNQDSEVFITNNVPDNRAYAIRAELGKNYLLAIEDEIDQIYISDYYREPVIIGLIIGFIVLVIIFGGARGVKAILSLTFTGLAIVYFLIPGIQSGHNPLALAVILSALATASTMLLIAGWTRKSLAATIGTTGGVATAGIIATIVIKAAPLSGLASTEAHILLANLSEQSLDFQGILAAGILIASLGAAMDVAISIASSAQEINDTNPQQSKKELFHHSMNIGKDIMGTMVNTLILAYTGASIPLFLLLYSEAGLRLLNMEVIATELSAAVIGSIGLLLAIPITSLAAVTLLKNFKAQGSGLGAREN